MGIDWKLWAAGLWGGLRAIFSIVILRLPGDIEIALWMLLAALALIASVFGGYRILKNKDII